MTASGSLPRAVISRSALSASARAAVDAGGEVADLRADAFGHGVMPTARVAAAAGVRRVIVDDSTLVERLRPDGIDAVTNGTADIDSELLYGLSGAGLRLAPVMTLSGRILARKVLRAGEAVSYGYTHRATHDTTIALVTGGYAQGIVRALGNAAHVGVGGALRPIVGRVAMDVCVIDLQDAPEDIGDEIVYFGGGAAVDELSTWIRVTGMRATELVTIAGIKAVREWTQ